MKHLIRTTAWKVTLKNPYSGLELQDGELVSLHNNKNGKTYKNVVLRMETEKGAYGVPIKKFFILEKDKEN